MPKFVDLFAGSGGLSYGLQQAGWEPILACEIWDDAVQTYCANFGDHPVFYNDIKQLSEKALGDLLDGDPDWVVGGPPCQGFSLAGKRQKDDLRNNLWQEYVRFVSIIKPSWFIFENVLEQRHRDRFNIVMGKEIDTKSIGYNTNQSEIAIGSGGWTGKGWLQGTQTKGKFVPEQDTDYIFSTVGEEWGFLGSIGVVILFITLIIRLLILAERQKSQYSRIYGYSVSSILFFHFFINIGMVSGLLPTIGIPLPFFSYGGSGLWGFTILLFIFIRLDASNYINR